MEPVSLKKLARAAGSDCAEDVMVGEVCIDTRRLTPGCLFVAIKGERFDGHDFVLQALEQGAAAAVSERAFPDKNIVLVPDTHQALLDLARCYRSLFRLFTVGVTGSVGKTSTKEMIAAILSERGKTLKTEGNFNNEIGMPLTMFRLDSSYQNAVVEMGMSAFGEISALTKVCRPNVGVITNIGVSHLETLGSRENILRAKLEIVDGMAEDAPLVLNADDGLLRLVPEQTERPVLTYGIQEPADVTASDIEMREDSTFFTIRYYGRAFPARIPALGTHNVYNALAGFCVGVLAEMEPETIVRAMKRYKNAAMRQNTTVNNGVTIIEDCYNASPDSMRAALDVITHVNCTGRRVCVFGDMLELGSASEEGHLEVGRAVARADIDVLACFGERARDIKRGAMLCGMKNVASFTGKEELAAYLSRTLQPGDAVIYKASRGLHLEEVIQLVNGGGTE